MYTILLHKLFTILLLTEDVTPYGFIKIAPHIVGRGVHLFEQRIFLYLLTPLYWGISRTLYKGAVEIGIV